MYVGVAIVLAALFHAPILEVTARSALMRSEASTLIPASVRHHLSVGVGDNATQSLGSLIGVGRREQAGSNASYSQGLPMRPPYELTHLPDGWGQTRKRCVFTDWGPWMPTGADDCWAERGRKTMYVVNEDDADGGGWHKVLETATGSYTPTTHEVPERTPSLIGGLSEGYTALAFSKLSDEEINYLAGSRYIIRFISGKDLRFKLYIRVSDVKFSDVAHGFGYVGKGTPLCVARSLKDCDWAGQSCKTRLDSLCGTTPNDCSRWFTDFFGAPGCGPTDQKSTVRCFTSGYLCNHMPWTDLTVWVKPLVHKVTTKDCSAKPKQVKFLKHKCQLPEKAPPPLQVSACSWVNDLYATVLCREPDEETLQKHTDECENGKEEEDLRQELMDSQEYKDCDKCKNECQEAK